jgi:hypothetical protein
MVDMDNSFIEELKQQSGFLTWRGKTHSDSTRFHHFLLPPRSSVIGEYHIGTAARQPSSDPALDWTTWVLNKGSDAQPSFDVNIREFESVEAMHDYLFGRLASISRRGVNFSPIPSGPGDVCILNKMARDNLLVEVVPVNPVDQVDQINILKCIDAWLLTQWPALTEKGGAEKGAPFEIRIASSSPTVKVGTELDLTVDVNGMDIKKLSHRFLVEPGRIIRRGDKYVFTCSKPGSASISIDVVDPTGRIGKASTSVNVVR